MAGIAENKLVMILLSIFLPPLAVFFKDGAGVQLIINIVLWIVTFGLGGIIHALWRVFR